MLKSGECGVAISETQKDPLSYLDYKTREFNPDNLESFTTIDIARGLSISRFFV